MWSQKHTILCMQLVFSDTVQDDIAVAFLILSKAPDGALGGMMFIIFNI